MTFTPKPFQTVPPPITAADVPLSTLAADMQQLVARQRACRLLAEAAERSHSPSDQIAYHLDEWLVTHPDAKVTQLADYPAWAAEMAARENANRAARNALRGDPVNELDLDPGMAAVVAYVREVHAPISKAITEGATVTGTDCAFLSGAMDALLGAIDARLPQPEQLAVALKAVA